MKKMFFIVLILTLGWSVSDCQLYKPVQPYNENGYSVSQFERFALNDTSSLSASYRTELLNMVNYFLQKTGLYKNYNDGQPLDESWIPWIFCPCRTWVEDRTYKKGFLNSHQSRNGKKVQWDWDTNYFHGPVTTLHLEGYKMDLGKTICMNLVGVPYTYPQRQVVPPIEKKVEEKPKPDMLLREYKPAYEIQDLGLTQKKVESKSWARKNWGVIAAWVATTAVNTIIVGEYHDWGKKPSSVVKTETGKGIDPPPNLGLRNRNVLFHF